MKKIALEVTGLCKQYPSFELRNVSFSLPCGYIMGLVGQNGAGKTTIINCILNEVQKAAGSVSIYGLDHILDEQKAKNLIGTVFDENHFPEFLNASEIEGIMQGVYSTWSSSDFAGFLDKFGLDAKQLISEYSKGMKVKLNLAVAMSHGARLLLLDEATSGLDPVIRDDVLDILLEFVQREQNAVLFSSHITSDLDKIADIVTFLHDGEVVFSKDKVDLMNSYGIINCGESTFKSIDPEDIVTSRKLDYQWRVLTPDRQRAAERYPEAVIDPVTIEDIMLLYIKGEQ